MRKEIIGDAVLHLGDCIDVMRAMPESSVDSIVTDPPYELGFMGKGWDKSGIANSVEMWREALRVLKPGGHLLAFSGSRTYHRMVCAIEDSGFEVRDQIMWLYGSGFPKSHDVSKAIDKAAGAEREVIGNSPFASRKPNGSAGLNSVGLSATPGAVITAPATETARQWQGWGTALKPAHEPIVVARKPLVGTVAANVLEHGTGSLNIDGCRVGGDPWKAHVATGLNKTKFFSEGEATVIEKQPHELGRWPANVIHDGLPQDWARFFYCAKSSRKDRDEGLECFEQKRTGGMSATADGSMLTGSGNERTTARANTHPTVKPTDLMRYLVRLVTPAGGTVLDPFMGSGSTGKAAMIEGFRFIGIDMTPEYIEIARARIAAAVPANDNDHVQLALGGV